MAVQAVRAKLGDESRWEPYQVKTAELLRIEPENITWHGTRVTATVARLLCVMIAEELRRSGFEPLDPDDPDMPAAEATLMLSEGTVGHPIGLLGDLSATPLTDAPAVVRVHEANENDWTLQIGVHANRARAGKLATLLLDRARGQRNPLRNCHLRAISVARHLELTAIPYPATTRADLHLPSEVWSTVDLDVHRHLARA